MPPYEIFPLPPVAGSALVFIPMSSSLCMLPYTAPI